MPIEKKISKTGKREKHKSVTRKIIGYLFFSIVMFVTYSFLVILLFKWINPPTTAFIQNEVYSGFANILSDEQIKIRWITYNKLSKQIVLAVIAAEDQRFPKHFGFDLREIEKAVQEKLEGKRLRGASTISQQVAKNLFLWQGKDYFRKGLESYYTLAIELLWDKKRIIEVYLNIAEFGDKIYGVENASRKYFHKSASKLNKYEAALLSAVLPSPKRFSVTKPTSFVKRRQKWILEQMRKLGEIKYLQELE